MLIIAKQFPNVKYLRLLLPLDESLFIDCLKQLFRMDDTVENKRCIWHQLILFSSELKYEQWEIDSIRMEFYDWFMQNTDLKYRTHSIYMSLSYPDLSIWI